MGQMACKDRLPALALAVSLALVACSGDDDADDTLAPLATSTTLAATSTSSTTSTTVAPTTTDPATTPPPSTEPPTTPPTDPPTTPPTTPAPTTAAPTTTAPAQALTIHQDGLGVVPFGTEADAAVAAVTTALGAPSDDTGWVDPASISGCAGDELRRVSWGVLSLYLGDPAGGGSRQFFTYSYGNVTDLGGQPAGLATPEGITLGDPVADLRAAYPSVEIVPGEEGLIEPSFYVNDNFGGLLTGESDTDSVTVMFGGPFCG